MFDLYSVKDSETGEYELKHPVTGNPTGTVLVLAGPEHPARRKLSADQARVIRSRIEKTGKFTLGDAEDSLDNENMLLNVAVLSWNVAIGGKPIECAPETKLKIFSDPLIVWFRRQVLGALEERTLFLSSSAPK